MISLDLLNELREFDTPLIANTINFIDSTPSHEFYLSGEIQSVTPSLGPTVGLVFTAEVDSSTPGEVAETDLFWQQLEAMAASKLPSVWVVKAVGSRPDHECIIGDGMAKLLFSVGCIGLVTDGRVRDIAGLMSTPFAAYCRGRIAHHAPLRIRAVDCPVEIGGIVIQPGDIIHACSEGVIRIPHSCLDRLASAAIRNRAFEHDVHRFLRRSDVTPLEKRVHIQKLMVQYGFADCISGG